MGWGTSFDMAEAILKHDTGITPELSGVVQAATEMLAQSNEFITPEMLGDKVRSNKVPTHDPYTNPKSHIYYSCECGQILDPGTSRFAELNNAASKRKGEPEGQTAPGVSDPVRPVQVLAQG